MASAATADSRLSTPIRKPSVKALGNTSPIMPGDRSGSFGIGSDAAMPPKRLPTVSTGRCSNATAADAPTTAISRPGHFGRQRFRPTIAASVSRPTTNALGLNVSRIFHSPSSLAIASAGKSPLRPIRSLIWPIAISAPTPLEKPRITGPGTYLTNDPSLRIAASTSSSPARNVAVSRPASPCFSTTATITTMNAAAGPPI